MFFIIIKGFRRTFVKSSGMLAEEYSLTNNVHSFSPLPIIQARGNGLPLLNFGREFLSKSVIIIKSHGLFAVIHSTVRAHQAEMR